MEGQRLTGGAGLAALVGDEGASHDFAALRPCRGYSPAASLPCAVWPEALQGVDGESALGWIGSWERTERELAWRTEVPCTAGPRLAGERALPC